MKKGLLGIAIIISWISAAELTAHSKDLGGSIGIGGSVEVGDITSSCSISKTCPSGATISCSASGTSVGCGVIANEGDPYEYIYCADGKEQTLQCCRKDGSGGTFTDAMAQCGKFAATQ